MANTKQKTDNLTIAVPPKERTFEEPRVQVMLPTIDGEDTEGVKVDQYEHVTLSNEKGDKTYYVQRGRYVDIPVSVYLVLKQKYPNI